jgi:hypothetical protein
MGLAVPVTHLTGVHVEPGTEVPDKSQVTLCPPPDPPGYSGQFESVLVKQESPPVLTVTSWANPTFTRSHSPFRLVWIFSVNAIRNTKAPMSLIGWKIVFLFFMVLFGLVKRKFKV